MKITFTEINRKWVLTIPINPESFIKPRTRKREVHEALHSDIDATGNLDLREYTIASFIPNKGKLAGKKYPFQLTNTPAIDVVKAMTYWIENDIALRMVVTSKFGNTIENVIVKVTEFTINPDRASDLQYTLSLGEHKPLSGV